MNNEFMKKLNALLTRSEFAQLSKSASIAASMDATLYAHQALLSQLKSAQTLDEIAEMVSNAIRQIHGADAAIEYTGVMVEFIKKEAASTCLTTQEVAQIVAPEVHRLLMRGIVPEMAVKFGLRNAGKCLHEAHCEKMTKHYFG